MNRYQTKVPSPIIFHTHTSRSLVLPTTHLKRLAMHIRSRHSMISHVSKIQSGKEEYSNLAAYAKYGPIEKRPRPIEALNAFNLRLIPTISRLHRFRRSFTLIRGLLGRFPLVSNSFDSHNVDEVVSNVARAIDFRDSRLEELGVAEHARRFIRISSLRYGRRDGAYRSFPATVLTSTSWNALPHCSR